MINSYWIQKQKPVILLFGSQKESIIRKWDAIILIITDNRVLEAAKMARFGRRFSFGSTDNQSMYFLYLEFIFTLISLKLFRFEGYMYLLCYDRICHHSWICMNLAISEDLYNIWWLEVYICAYKCVLGSPRNHVCNRKDFICILSKYY